ncbi:cytochrome P450 [Streptomyces sp. NPDC020800]|uniref:cytochrome P450 n=1 Tax=Streptomyces sp. NPDC020800 TaxID=3365092 RepID=UPI0037B60F76
MTEIGRPGTGPGRPAGGHGPGGPREQTRKPGAAFTAGAAPGRLPLLGHGHVLLRRPLPFLASLPSYGDLVEVRVGPMPFHVICHPELAHHVLTSDRLFDKGGPMFSKLRDLVGDGLASCPHAQHRRLRRLVNPAFRADRLPGYAEVMTAQTYAVTEHWQHGQVVDLHDQLLAVSARTLARTIFTAEHCADAVAAAVPFAQMITSGLTAHLLTPAALRSVPTPAKRRFVRRTAELRTAVLEAIGRYRRDGVDRGDLLSILLAEHDGDQLTDEEVFTEVVGMAIAGVETVASTLNWTFRLLYRHPEIERRLHAELDQVLGRRPPTWADLPALELTGRVFQEALRLFPSDWLLTRVTTEDTELAGRALPAGSIVAFSGYAVHQRADLYARPAAFDPDRWADPRLPRGGFLSFGGGGRKCIGDVFGTVEGTLALATIAGRWRFVPARPSRARPMPRTQRAALGYPMRVTAR